jgi:Tol biopolymer transport system component
VAEQNTTPQPKQAVLAKLSAGTTQLFAWLKRQLPSWNNQHAHRFVHGLTALVLLATIIFPLVQFEQAQAATGTIVPDGDVTTQWWCNNTTPACTSAQGGTHYTRVNGETNNASTFVSTGTSSTTGEIEEFTMTSVASSNVEVTQFSVRVHAHVVACLGNAPNCDSISVNIRKGGTLLTAQTFTLTTTNTEYTANFNGTWSSDSDVQVQIVRNRVGGGNAANADDDVRMTNVRAVVTYTPLIELEQSSYRWFDGDSPLGYGAPFTMVDKTDVDPTGTVRGVAFSPDGQYMTAAHSEFPYITIYKLNSGTGEFTKLDNPAQLPAGNALDVTFSADGSYMAVAHWGSPFVTIYEVDSGTDTFSKLSNPSQLPTDGGQGVSFSPDGKYLAVPHASTPHLAIYEIDASTNTFTKLSNPSTVPATTGTKASWHPTGEYLAVGVGGTAPNVIVYRVDSSANSFTKVSDSNFSELPTGAAQDLRFSPDGNYLAVAHSNGPYLTVYQINISADEFTAIGSSDYSVRPNFTGYGVSFSPDSKYMAFGSGSAPGERFIVYDIDALAGQDTVGQAPAEGTPFRLRATVGADQGALDAESADFKLQYAERAGLTCSVDFSAETYQDVHEVTEKGPLNFIDKLADPATMPGDYVQTTALVPRRPVSLSRHLYLHGRPLHHLQTLRRHLHQTG